jgi:methionine--tRNA ligase beta chain
MINFDEFQKLDLRAAKIVSAERVAGSDKLLKLQVEAGDGAEGEADAPVLRQIVAGIGKAYEPEGLIGKEIIIVANLEPRELLGLTSHGMLLAAKDVNGLSLIMPDKVVSPGSKIG